MVRGVLAVRLEATATSVWLAARLEATATVLLGDYVFCDFSVDVC